MHRLFIYFYIKKITAHRHLEAADKKRIEEKTLAKQLH